MRGQSGQTTVLVLGLVLVAFAVAGVAVDGTRAFLFRRTLQNAADSAALAGAGELDENAYYSSGGSRVVLDSGSAVSEANRILELRGLSASKRIGIDRGAVAVILRDEVATSFLGVVGIERIPVAADARAEPFAGAAP